MIIWIASYPKSGNTWVRSLLSTYLYTEDGSFNFNLLKKILKFPSKIYLKYFTKDFSDIKKISEYWISAQERINLFNENKSLLLKTHSALCTLENNSFTNKQNTQAVIYIVRDPRNVITSISHHYSLNIEESYNFIINKNNMITQWGSETFGVATILGSWLDHYKSWKNLKFSPILIVKYEDLVNDTKKTFTSVLNFLENLMNIDINEKRIINTVNSCQFDVLAKKEKIEGFSESVTSKKDTEKINFFYLGEKNNWKNLLDPKIEKKIKELFLNEMTELGYI